MKTRPFHSAILTSVISSLAVALVLMLPSRTLIAQGPQKQESAIAPFNAAEAHQAAENLAKQLEENFIYPKIGKAYAEMLRSKVSSGAYSKFASAAEFAKVVTADLQAVQPEGHLRLQDRKSTRLNSSHGYTA